MTAVRPLRVLVVEDDRQFLGYLCSLLASWGYDILPARSATEALAFIDDECPPVVISDLIMPGMSGIDLLHALRQVKGCPPFFILLTGYGSVSAAVRAIMEGANEVLVKPVKDTELLRLLQRVEAQLGEAAAR